MASDSRLEDTRIIDSSGNVFVDLGFPPHEAEVYALRSELMNRLEQLMRERGWSTAESAVRLNIGIARAAELMCGKWQNFSLETLVTLAARAGL
ncbi:XRE family transcriptional regulator [uncultured Thiodictyon sp.]|uniref:helix-turn-helix domain-containing protein n=1 Tax=uncultured Thiodictyon sp. TaxID=1846217 RepID=UPI0025E05FCA|nr:XRE family transcriptional regulator [uncultured Thiodictyon sp.]